jgi:hypothetical protein
MQKIQSIVDAHSCVGIGRNAAGKSGTLAAGAGHAPRNTQPNPIRTPSGIRALVACHRGVEPA